MQRNKKAELFNDLHMGKVEVLFQKVSGERRKMICTLAPKALVEKFGTKYTGKVEFDAKAKAQPVFDVEKQEWRSFLYDKVLNYEKMPLEEKV
jgi:uncharacterized protein (DUF2249 family)|tara:strand:+ start:339 stop:617 length:279 start_codon:yes stop_codon:yes gene_type:complete